jgi:hypothetical protein
VSNRYDYTDAHQEHLRLLRAELEQLNEDIAWHNQTIEEAQRLKQLTQSRARRTADQIISIERAAAQRLTWSTYGPK